MLIIVYFALTHYVAASEGLTSFLQDLGALRIAGFLFLNLIAPAPPLMTMILIMTKETDDVIFSIIYSVVVLASIIFSVIAIKKKIELRIVPHDRKYLQDVLATSGKDGRLYTISKKDLARKILGKKANPGELKSVYSVIDEQIKPIKKFLKDEQQDSSTLVIDSKWGTGKTTSLLIAIDETKNIKRDDKFIYESVFRYSASMDEFIKDFLNTFSNVLYELGIDAHNDMDTLIENYELSPTKIISNILKAQNSSINLSIEIMAKINKLYEDTKKKNKIKSLVFIIFDDLDRLQGDDVLKVLSLLSSLRHLSFVRIIIPADIDTIAEILRGIKVPEPEKYVEKYLPEQTSVKIDFGYSVAEEIIITALNKAGIASDDGCYPIWGAMLIAILSKVLWDETRSLEEHRGDWLSEMYSGNPKEVGWLAYRILKSAPAYMMEQSDETLARAVHSTDRYYWDSAFNSIQHFENIVYAIRTKKDKRAIHDVFSYEDYCALIDPWIFSYAEAHWNEFGLTMRAALDCFNKIKPVLSEMPRTAEEEFAFTWNQFFPNKKIRTANNTAEGDNGERK